MADIYFTITGTRYRHGTEYMKSEMKVKLVKEPDNEYDNEAIRVEMPGIGLVGYVANSTHTVIGECYSAGRIYDKIGDEATGEILYVLSDSVICVLNIVNPAEE
ncbi:MAG: HIRAN domain-containing protein [Lachnospiraceae bacterium]|nr:HIRAN domain-containing protein [Candidatus Colinaster scatohippi]